MTDNDKQGYIVFLQGIQSSFSQFSNTIDSIKIGLTSFIETFAELAQYASIMINAADNCKKNQWIIYHEIPAETYMLLGEASADSNAIMLEYYKRNDYENFKQLYCKYKDFASVAQHKLTLEQAYNSLLARENYNLIVYSLTAVFDGVLAKITKNSTWKFNERFKAFENLTVDEACDIISNTGKATSVAFLYTFDAIKSLDIYISFETGPEPEGLNRHWIMHGRSEKQFTEIDCLKIFNFIFSLLYVGELGIIGD